MFSPARSHIYLEEETRVKFYICIHVFLLAEHVADPVKKLVVGLNAPTCTNLDCFIRVFHQPYQYNKKIAVTSAATSPTY